MVDKTSWTEPLGSERKRPILGIERDGDGKQGRGEGCMDDGRGVPERKWRCAHYGRGPNEGQRSPLEYARGKRAPREGCESSRLQAETQMKRVVLMVAAGAVGRWWQ